MKNQILLIPENVLRLHTGRNDFSKWLNARAIFQVAELFKPVGNEDFPSMDQLRKYIYDSISSFRIAKGRGVIAKFDRNKFNEYLIFSRIGEESSGGKARGLAFINSIIEKHFSVFMDAIYENNGDVVETAGDGLMVLFLNEDKQASALEAVNTALSIREKTTRIWEKCSALYRPLDINMGSNSGQALVGAAKFETYSGSRWTYTARGKLTNVAARIGAQATGGSIYLSKSTADRIKDHFSPVPKGKFKLKNVSEEVEIFEL
mgnify:CR=1 FL=1